MNTRPVKALLLMLIAAALDAAPAETNSRKSAATAPALEEAKLPSAREVLERYQKAIGGSDAFKKHQSQHATGTLEMPGQGIRGGLEVFAARPNKLVMKTSIPGVGDLNTGYDGKVGWMSSAITGPMLLEGKMLEQVATQADFDQALHDPGDYKTAKVIGQEDFNGEPCYKLRLVHRTGFDTTEFFSTKNGLQKGFISTQESPLGPVTATTTVVAYKQFGDLYMPSKISQKAAGMQTVMTITNVEYDAVDPAVFELPREVKALLEKPAPDPSKPEGKKPEPVKSGSGKKKEASRPAPSRTGAADQ